MEGKVFKLCFIIYYMYLKLNNQKQLINKAVKKAGSSRKLALQINVPSSSIDRYLVGGFIPDERVSKLLGFIGIKNIEKYITNKLEDNFRQKSGGLNCVKAKKEKGTFERDMKKLQDIQSRKLKKWHHYMKTNKPEEYYKLQYNRFKKIGGYNYKTKKGELVRNLFEKKVADIFFNLGLDYQYEPLIKSGDKYFFPDFLINEKIIIECTMWRGEVKSYKLKDKISYLEPKYKVFVVIPKGLYRYYRILDNHLILGLDEFASVAQTFFS